MKLKGNLNVFKGKLQQAYSDLADDDFQYKEGKEDEMLGRLQQATGESKEDLKEMIDRL